MLFQQHQNRTKDSCYAQKTSFFSSLGDGEACEADVVSLLLFPWKHFSCQDSIIFWPQLDYSQIIYHLSYIVNRQIPSGTSETLKRAADEVAKMTAMLQMEVIMSRAGNQDVNTKILDH